MKLSVVIPVYNEEKTVRDIVEKVRGVNVEKEIIIVDDCSKDGTAGVLKEIAQKYKDIRVVYSSPNRGKGYAIKQGFKLAEGDVIIIQDADLEYDPDGYLKIMEMYGKGPADIVYGSRFLGRCEGMSFAQLFANKFFNLLTNLIHGSNLTDVCTCYKSFKADILRRLALESDSFGICHELNAKFLKNDYKIKEVPIDYRARTWKEGKKAGVRSFFVTFYAIVKYGLEDKKKSIAGRGHL